MFAPGKSGNPSGKSKLKPLSDRIRMILAQEPERAHKIADALKMHETITRDELLKILDGKELLLEPLLVATPDRRLRIENRGRIAVGDERSLELRSAWVGVAWPLAGAPVVSKDR